MFALPALHAPDGAYPRAEIVLLGKPWQAAFIDGRPGPVDRVVVMPAPPGVGAAVDADVDPAAIDAFVADVPVDDVVREARG